VAACPACEKALPGEFPFCPYCTAPLTGESREQRKTVTVLFCDVTGSTALGESTDPEALRALLARYFERMKGIVESHGEAAGPGDGVDVRGPMLVPGVDEVAITLLSRGRRRRGGRAESPHSLRN
jgi:class 3 adenylate cyclase